MPQTTPVPTRRTLSATGSAALRPIGSRRQTGATASFRHSGNNVSVPNVANQPIVTTADVTLNNMNLIGENVTINTGRTITVNGVTTLRRKHRQRRGHAKSRHGSDHHPHNRPSRVHDDQKLRRDRLVHIPRRHDRRLFTCRRQCHCRHRPAERKSKQRHGAARTRSANCRTHACNVTGH